MTDNENCAETEQETRAFERKMERLAEIVRSLETDPPSLKDSLTLYREGKELARECRRELEEAEQIIEKLEE